jgi:hypothetical protein
MNEDGKNKKMKKILVEMDIADTEGDDNDDEDDASGAEETIGEWGLGEGTE